ncbi:MAG: hypothetical protein U1E13_09190 [Methylophilaceae bacterium]|nr:hypothetical protein [Methylophilaceae bacterium]
MGRSVSITEVDVDGLFLASELWFFAVSATAIIKPRNLLNTTRNLFLGS